MKKLVLFFIVTVASFGWAGNDLVEEEIPQVVVSNFHYFFPGAQAVQWQKLNNNYKALYLENDKKLEVFYNANGELQEIDREIDSSELPNTYVNRLNEAFGTASYTIKNAMVADDFSRMPLYLIQVQKGPIVYSIEFEDYDLKDKILHVQRQNTFIW